MKSIVILGAGYGGIKVLNKLQKTSESIKITIIDENNYHCEKISLMDVASGLVKDRKICFAIEDIIDNKKTKFIQDKVDIIDHNHNKVLLNKKGEISYDYLVVALGFHSETFNIPGVNENSLPMDDVTSADNINLHIINEMKKYKKDKDPIHLNILVCGAGFTGVELLGSLNDMKEQYAKLAGVNKNDIILECVDHSSKFLPMFNEKLSNYGLKWMNSHVKFYSQCGIKEIKPQTVIYTDSNNDEHTLSAGTIIWTTGVSGSDIIQKSGYQEHRGRVKVKNDLRSPVDDNVFIIGDVSAFFPDGSKRPYPTTAQIALAMGTCAAQNIINLLNNRSTEAFKYNSLGTVASLGNTKAFGVGLGVPVEGYIGSVTKKMIDDLSLYETGKSKELLSKGKFDFYH